MLMDIDEIIKFGWVFFYLKYFTESRFYKICILYNNMLIDKYVKNGIKLNLY